MSKRSVPLNIENCTGCSACFSVCPENAIKMLSNNEGFLYPQINAKKCTDCALCAKICPALGRNFSPEHFAEPQTFVAYAGDNIRRQSSSGGIFGALALSVLKRGGYVCGAAFNAKWYVKHLIIDNQKDLPKLQRSKYVQSEIGNIYKELKKLLIKDKKVLFAGTPCQVAGLYACLQKDYENLWTVDLICHGVPSPRVFAEYLTEITNGEKILSVNFRDKRLSWEQFCLTVKTNNSVYSRSLKEDVFLRGFLENLYLRLSCHFCPYTKMRRVSDITLGDFWLVNKYKKTLNDRKGISRILLNTSKGKNFFAGIQRKLSLVRPLHLSIIKDDPVLREPVIPHKNRAAFFARLIEGNSVINLIQSELGAKNVGIINYCHSNSNYGAVLLAYAMSRMLEKLGYRPVVIDFVPYEVRLEERRPSVFEDFRRKYLRRTALCYSDKQLARLNKELPRIIVAGDQTMRYPYGYTYLLKWAKGLKTLIMYSVSFGRKKKVFYDPLIWRKCLCRFDAVSAREHSGAETFKRYGVKAPVVLDPVLLLDAQDYQSIIDAERLNNFSEEYAAYGLLDKTILTQLNEPAVLAGLKSKCRFVNILKDENGRDRTFGEWLSYIKGARYVITNSFHSVVIALIFQKQFVVIQPTWRGNERMLNLFEQFNISKNRLFENIADITPQSFNVPIDYCKINSILAGERKKSLHFLTKALGIEPNYKRIIIGGSWLPLYTRLKVNIIKDYSPVIKKVVSKLFH